MSVYFAENSVYNYLSNFENQHPVVKTESEKLLNPLALLLKKESQRKEFNALYRNRFSQIKTEFTPLKNNKVLEIPTEMNKTSGEVSVKLNFNDFRGHKWFDAGGFLITFFPFKIVYPGYSFELDPHTGEVTIELLQCEKPMCLYIEDKAFVSSKYKKNFYKIKPIKNDVVVFFFEFDDSLGVWKANCKRNFSIKVFKKPEIIPQEKRGNAIDSLAIPKTEMSDIMNCAQGWLGKGLYIRESLSITKDIFNQNQYHTEDVILLALSAAGYDESFGISPTSKKESENRILLQKANFNCWQFSLLAYIQSGYISWKLVGEIYNILGSDRIPEAIKCGNFHSVDFKNKLTTPNPGDMLFFCKQIDKGDWHCAIFKECDPEKGTLSCIQISNNKVEEIVVTLNNPSGSYLSFVRKEDVQENLLNYLALKDHSSNKKVDI